MVYTQVCRALQSNTASVAACPLLIQISVLELPDA